MIPEGDRSAEPAELMEKISSNWPGVSRAAATKTALLIQEHGSGQLAVVRDPRRFFTAGSDGQPATLAMSAPTAGFLSGSDLGHQAALSEQNLLLVISKEALKLGRHVVTTPRGSISITVLRNLHPS